jgi:hypothetical protein
MKNAWRVMRRACNVRKNARRATKTRGETGRVPGEPSARHFAPAEEDFTPQHTIFPGGKVQAERSATRFVTSQVIRSRKGSHDLLWLRLYFTNRENSLKPPRKLKPF